MQVGEQLVVRSRQQWRGWLARHHRDRKEIWLIYAKKGSRQPGIPYDESVEEALCFGWIDGQMRGIDAERYAVRFSPRRPGGNWSASNRARVIRLLRDGRMTEAGKAAVPADLVLEGARHLDSHGAEVR